MATVNLGDEVIDTVSGFKGIATSRTVYLNGCVKIGIQPKCGRDGKLVDAWFIDEPQLRVTKPAKPVTPKHPFAVLKTTGGPNTRIPSERASR